MKKALAASLLFAVSAGFSAAEEIKIDFDGKPAVKVAVPDIPVPVKGAAVREGETAQDLEFRFRQAADQLRRLDSETTWLKFDVERIERDVQMAGLNNSPNLFVENDMRRMQMDLSRRNNDLQRLGYELRDLVNLAVKDAKLNQLASNMSWDHRDLLNRFQFDVENAAQRLEWTVRGVKPQLIGYSAQWLAADISRESRDITWKLRDMEWPVRDLVAKTQP